MLRTLLGFGGEQVDPNEAVRRIDQGARLIDVREPGEFSAGHAPGAIHVPLGRVRQNGVAALEAAGLPPDTREILLVCQSGMRSRLAQSVLLRGRHPARRYLNVRGGMAAWASAGLPVVRDARNG